jgi:hypothetical protein
MYCTRSILRGCSRWQNKDKRYTNITVSGDRGKKKNWRSKLQGHCHYINLAKAIWWNKSWLGNGHYFSFNPLFLYCIDKF